MGHPELKMNIEKSVYKSAYITRCGHYRYWLKRQWNFGENFVCWVMLNPSTADEKSDDPTLKKCIGFSKKWGFDGLIVANLFGFRSTDPEGLKSWLDPVGKHNDCLALFSMSQCSKIICAWGNHGSYLNRQHEFHEIALPYSQKLYCLGKTNSGHPKHPVRLGYKTELIKY